MDARFLLDMGDAPKKVSCEGEHHHSPFMSYKIPKKLSPEKIAKKLILVDARYTKRANPIPIPVPLWINEEGDKWSNLSPSYCV